MRVYIPVGLRQWFGTSHLRCRLRGGFVVKLLDDTDKVCTEVVLPHGCPQGSMPCPVEGLLVVDENMLKVFLVLEVLFAKDSEVEYLFSGAPAFSKTCLFFCNDLFRPRLVCLE